MYMHPTDYLWLKDQDREREMTQRALERAARSGDPDGDAPRGGISAFVESLRATLASIGGPRSTGSTQQHPTGPTGA